MKTIKALKNKASNTCGIQSISTHSKLVSTLFLIIAS